MRKIMACLDVGSDAIKLVIGEIVKKKLNVLAVADVPSFGVKNGIVDNPNELLQPLESVIRKCEEIIGLSIKQMIVSVAPVNAEYQVVNGTIQITNEGNLIEGKDVIRVMQKAVKASKKDDLEYITMMPTSFSLDDDRMVKDPKGLTSKELSVRGVMVSTPKKNIYPILACLERLGIDVLDIAISSIGDYYEFRTKETDKGVGVVINIGDEISTVSVFNKGILTNSKVIMLGGRNIDNDISFIYKVPFRSAKELKEGFAFAYSSQASDKESVHVEDKSSNVVEINQKEISEVVMSRLEEILNLCKKEINHLTKKEISYIILTGGVTECRDINLLLKEIFDGNYTLGEIREIGVRNNKYSSCLGLLKFYAANAKLKDKDYSIFSIEDQQILSGSSLDSENESVIGKLFGYIFNG